MAKEPASQSATCVISQNFVLLNHDQTRVFFAPILLLQQGPNVSKLSKQLMAEQQGKQLLSFSLSYVIILEACVYSSSIVRTFGLSFEAHTSSKQIIVFRRKWEGENQFQDRN